MSAPIDQPIRVVVQNFADAPAREPLIKTSTLHTYILDPATAAYQWYAITNVEPKRVRLAITVIDAPCLLVSEAPNPIPSPASVAGGPPPQGLYLPVTPIPAEFYGPDAFWLVAITGSTAGRVTVVKEYC